VVAHGLFTLFFRWYSDWDEIVGVALHRLVKGRGTTNVSASKVRVVAFAFLLMLVVAPLASLLFDPSLRDANRVAFGLTALVWATLIQFPGHDSGIARKEPGSRKASSQAITGVVLLAAVELVVTVTNPRWDAHVATPWIRGVLFAILIVGAAHLWQLLCVALLAVYSGALLYATDREPDRGALDRWAAETWLGTRVYFGYVAFLLLPGHRPPSYYPEEDEEVAGRVASLSGWRDDDLAIMIDEGRRELDRQMDDLKEIRARAQWLFTAALTLTVALAAAAIPIFKHGGRVDKGMWVASLVAASYGALGGAAINTVRADYTSISTWALAAYDAPIHRKLAVDYAEVLGTGKIMLDTRISLFRQAVVWVIVGGALGLTAWLRIKT
jgi:hypothetical protein